MSRTATGSKSASGLSFANELASMRASATGERAAANPQGPSDQEIFMQNNLKPDFKSNQALGMMPAINESISEKMKMKLKELRDKETESELSKFQVMEESTRTAEEIADKFIKSETTMASAAQESHKQITEAYKEGSLGQEQAQQYNGNDRKKQLANWEELAPRIVEDPKNRAVRIDIPGLNDVQTLIVRMKRDAVSIQVVGDKSTMERLQANESELNKNLRAHDIKLASLQAFDIASLKQGAR